MAEETDNILANIVNRGMKQMAVNHARDKGDTALAEELEKMENGFSAYTVVTLIHGEPPGKNEHDL